MLLYLIIIIIVGSTTPPGLIAFPDLAQAVDHRLALVNRDQTGGTILHGLDSLGRPGRSGQCGKDTKSIAR